MSVSSSRRVDEVQSKIDRFVARARTELSTLRRTPDVARLNNLLKQADALLREAQGDAGVRTTPLQEIRASLQAQKDEYLEGATRREPKARKRTKQEEKDDDDDDDGDGEFDPKRGLTEKQEQEGVVGAAGLGKVDVESLKRAAQEHMGGGKKGGKKKAQKQQPAPAAARSALEVLNETFSRPFAELTFVGQALYELIWSLTYSDRRAFLAAYAERLKATLTDADRILIGRWINDLVRASSDREKKPRELTFNTSYFNPQVLGLWGQSLLNDMIHDMFANGDRSHSGGISGPLVLARPNWQAIHALIDDLERALRNVPQQMEAEEEEEEGGEAAPVPVSEGLFAPLPPSKFPSATAADVSSIKVSLMPVQLALVNAQMASHLDEWLRDHLNAGNVPKSLSDFQQQLVVTEHQRIADNSREYTNQRKALLNNVQRQMAENRVQLGQEGYNELQASLDLIDRKFVGLYAGKLAMVRYLSAQLAAGDRTDTSNHLLVTGEPGTGKTKLVSHMATMMVRLNLIKPPSMESYTALGTAYRKNIEHDEEVELNAREIEGVPSDIAQFLPDDVMFALRFASRDGLKKQTDRPRIFAPALFESQFQGGRVAQLLGAIMGTLGSVMIVDEAYTLQDEQFRPVIDALTDAIERYKLQWGSALVGYKNRIDNLMRTNEGLSSRYQASLDFGFYTGAELTAIFASLVFATDNMTLTTKFEHYEKLASRVLAGQSIKQEVFALFDQYYDKIAYHAQRDDGGLPHNLFGSGNGRSVLGAYSWLSAGYRARLMGGGLQMSIYYLSPQKVAEGLKARVGKPFSTLQ